VVVKTYKVRDPEALELITTLARMPGFERLADEVEGARKEYFANLARGLAMHNTPVDQREIDEKRGFWKGALWALRTFPKQTSNEWDKFVEAALKEDESSE
jgi:hypothetical protein